MKMNGIGKVRQSENMDTIFYVETFKLDVIVTLLIMQISDKVWGQISN
jgi:hypothetical protein